VRNASHTYTTTGYHTVSLTVTGSDGQTDSEIKPGYISIEIPTIELFVGDLSQDPSLISSQTAPPVQSTPQAQSVPLAESGLQAQSLPMAQSVPMGLPEYQDQSFPQDSSPQNGLSAGVDPINVKQPSVFWPLNRSVNNKLPAAFWMMIKSPLLPWKVMVYDAESKLTPKGRMAEYNLSLSSYVPGGKFLTDPLRLQSERNNVLSPTSGPVNLTAYPGKELQEGPAFNTEGFKYNINLDQYVGPDDHRPGPGNQYRVVITFEAQTL